MTYFIGADGERITTVTQENLPQFFEYLKTVTQEQKADLMSLYNSSKGWDYEIKIADDVKLKDYFSDFADRTSSEKHFLVGRINESLSRNMPEKRKQEVFDLAKTNKEAFAYWYDFDDRKSDYGCSEIVIEKAKENKFSENLYVIDALTDRYGADFLYGQRENIRTLPKDKSEIIARLFADAKVYNDKSKTGKQATNREAYSQRLIRNILERGDLLNYEPKNVNVAGISAGEIRTQIDNSVNADNIRYLDRKFIFDGKQTNKYFLKLLFDKQLEKDFNALKENKRQEISDGSRKSFVESRNLILDAAESVVGKYIPNSRGEERTHTQKFQALVEELYGKPFASFSGYKVIQDYLLNAAYRDINTGNAAKLDNDSLLLVVQNDQDGYWLKKISKKSPETAKKIIKEMNDSFSIRQSRVADIIAPEITLDHGTAPGRTGDIFDTKLYKYQHTEYNKGVSESKYMSTAEKMEFLEKAEIFVDEKLLQQAKEDKAFAAEFRKDYAEHNDLCNQAYAKEKMRSRLTSLQGLYADIIQKFEDGKPNDAEKHLSEEKVEEVLKDFPNCQGINLPVQGKLPLLFGRKKEEERRIELVQAIRNFNDELQNFQNEVKNPENKWGKYVDVGEFEGEMLNRHTIEQLKVERDVFNAKVQENNQKLNNKYYGKGKYGGHYNYDDAERAEKWSALQEQRIQNIETEKQKVLARKGQLKEAAKSVRAPETSTLKAVTADMDKDTKAAIRESNKQITDTLEKPVTERIKKVRNGR